MRRYLPLSLTAVLTLSVSACETGDETRVLTISGTVRDYFSNAAGPGIVLDWEDPLGLTVTSSSTGDYQITGLLETDIVFITGSAANVRSTRNEPVVLGTSNATADVFVVTTADAARQHTAVGDTPTTGTADVYVTLVDALGQPHENLPLADIMIADTADDPVGLGPFVFGSAGDIVPQATLSVTTAFNGRARVAFLNVPRGRHELRVAYDDNGTPRTKTRLVDTDSAGVTLLRR
jgi:hypothetical protein